MKYYEITILESTNKNLNESISDNIPTSFYVKCKNGESAYKCFSKISSQFEKKYGVVIESVDIKRVDEGFFSRVGAGLKAIGAGAMQPIKNIGHGLAAAGKAAVGNKEGAKKSLDKTKSIKQGAKDSQKKSLVKMIKKELINSFNDIYGSDETYDTAILGKIIKATEYFFNNPA